MIDPQKSATEERPSPERLATSTGWSSADIARITIAPLFVAAGLAHLLGPGLFAPVMPKLVPEPHLVIMLTGVAELAGVTGLFVSRLRATAGIMLALYAICVFPVNIIHAVHDLGTGTGLGWAYHYPRLFAQPLVCWWALAAGRIVEVRLVRRR